MVIEHFFSVKDPILSIFSFLSHMQLLTLLLEHESSSRPYVMDGHNSVPVQLYFKKTAGLPLPVPGLEKLGFGEACCGWGIGLAVGKNGTR